MRVLQQRAAPGLTPSSLGRSSRVVRRTLNARAACSADQQPQQPDGRECSTSRAALAASSSSSGPRLSLPVRLMTCLRLQQPVAAAPALPPLLASSSGGAATCAASSSSSSQPADAWQRRRQQLGAALLSAAVAAPNLGGGPAWWLDLCSNYVFLVGFWGWFCAQFGKIFTKRFKSGVWDPLAFLEAGGTPSSHSSLCASITTALAMSQGLGSPLFAIAICFSVIVMYDAMGVRRHAGLQAQVLNVVVAEYLEGHPMSERKLKEVLGHTPRQVLAGAVLGLLVGLVFPYQGRSPLAAALTGR